MTCMLSSNLKLLCLTAFSLVLILSGSYAENESVGLEKILTSYDISTELNESTDVEEILNYYNNYIELNESVNVGVTPGQYTSSEHYVMIGANDFKPFSYSSDLQFRIGSFGAYCEDGSSITAPVHLPHGVVVTGLDIFAYCENITAPAPPVILCSLIYRTVDETSNNMTFVFASTNAEDGYHHWVCDNFDPPLLVNNEKHSYHIVAIMMGANADDFAAFSINGVKITYINPRVSLASYNFPTRYIRHCGFLGVVTEIATDLGKQDATFNIVQGLADSSCVSFESVNYPGFYLRHSDFRLRLDPANLDQTFKEDATFKVVSGLGDINAYSFESYNYPGQYIKHNENFELYVEPCDTGLSKQEATFWMNNALYSS